MCIIMNGAPARNRTSISGSGGLRHIHWTTGANLANKIDYMAFPHKMQGADPKVLQKINGNPQRGVADRFFVRDQKIGDCHESVSMVI